MIRSDARSDRSRPGRARVVALAMVVLFALGQAPLSRAAAMSLAQNGTIVRCDPLTVTGTTDQTLTVDLYIQDVVDLYGLDLKVTFDPTVAQVVDESTQAGVQILPLSTFLQPDFVVRNLVDNTAGTIRFAATQVGRPESATGSGPVARIRFTALKPGQFIMPFISYELSDRNGGMILSTPQSCTVTFKPPTSVGCDPAFIIGRTGHDLTVNLQIQNVSALYGVDLRATFDQTIARVVDEDPATGGVQILPLNLFLQPDFVVHREADNTAGSIQYTAAQMSPSPPVTGSGPVAQVRFMPLKEGQFTMKFVQHELSDPNGVLIPHVVQECTIGFYDPTAVTMAGFTALQQGDKVRVAWETASEIDSLGFNVYRSDSAAGGRTRLNDAVILAQAAGLDKGATYSWLDSGCRAGTTYFYWLEAVGLDGQLTLHGPASASCAGPTAVSVQDLRATRQTQFGMPVAVILAWVALYGVRRSLRAH